jgi:hypothetical protein
MFKEGRPKETKSILPTIAEKKSLFARKYSDRVSGFNDLCFTPSYATPEWGSSHHFDGNDKAFLNE